MLYILRDLRLHSNLKIMQSIQRLHNYHMHNLKIAWFACAIYIYELRCCNTWQWVIYCHGCVAHRLEDKQHLSPQGAMMPRLISYLLWFLTATFSLDHAQVLHVPTWELKGSPQVCMRPHREFFMGPDFYKQHNLIFDKFYFHCRVVGSTNRDIMYFRQQWMKLICKIMLSN